MKTNETQVEQTKTIAALWDQYQYEQANETGFFATSRWNNDKRNFAAFLAEKRVAADFDRAMTLIGAKI